MSAPEHPLKVEVFDRYLRRVKEEHYHLTEYTALRNANTLVKKLTHRYRVSVIATLFVKEGEK